MRLGYAQAQIDAPLGNSSIYIPPSSDRVSQWLTWNAASKAEIKYFHFILWLGLS